MILHWLIAISIGHCDFKNLVATSNETNQRNHLSQVIVLCHYIENKMFG